MNIEQAYELEILVIGNILNDRKHLKEIAVLPEYFFDNSCWAILDYVTKNETYNLYDMAKDLDINFELVTDLAENPCNKQVFQDRVIKLSNYAHVRKKIMDEIHAAHVAMTNQIDPISVGSILRTNLGKILND